MGFRPAADAQDKKCALSSPGPGVYSPGNFTIAENVDRRSKVSAADCTFGISRQPLKPIDGPGPASYAPPLETEPGAKGKHMPGPLLYGRVKPPMPYATPGPGEYKITSFVDDTQGRIMPTMKGRLPHPMDSKLVDFESAKTSCPRLPNRTLRARPRL
jgi:hypothetical protein